MATVIITAFVVAIVIGLLAALPAISIDVDAVVASSAWHWIRAALYFIPTHTVVMILSVIVALGVFRIIVALVHSIWDLLP